MDNKKVYSCVIKCPVTKKACGLINCELYKEFREYSTQERMRLLGQDNPAGNSVGITGHFCSAQNYIKVKKYVLFPEDDVEGLNTYLKNNNLFIEKIIRKDKPIAGGRALEMR